MRQHLSRRSLILIAVIAAVVTACGGGAGSDGPFDFSEIAIGEPVMAPAPSGTSATLTVATRVVAVCAVAYGETEALGHLATDQDMGGVGHAEHAAVLTGLAPDTEYFYRLNGVGPDGRVYQSELMTFRTPPGDASSGGAGNVAIGATVVDVSSEFSAAFAAANAVDGDLATAWSSRGDGDDAFITVDLGRTVRVIAVGFETRSMIDGSAVTDTYTVTADNATYGPFDAGVAAVEFTARVVRFDVEVSTGGNTGAHEVQVFAGP